MSDTNTKPYEGYPTWPSSALRQPSNPPHACMGLNSCKGQDRFGFIGPPDGINAGRPNECAGQGFCSTTADHTCHVKNDCAHQGGCGLYGTAAEQNRPGGNACGALGSCATPINAERFSTDGPNRDKSVWLRARKVFQDTVWNELKHEHPDLPDKLPRIGGEAYQSLPDDFKYGPPHAWISAGGTMTACGASGLSGAGSCV